MKNRIFLTAVSILLILFFANESSFSQTQQTRYLKQHKSYFLKEHLQQTEDMLLQALYTESVDMKPSAVQTIRELEEIFPTESFSLFIKPLSDLIQDENAEIQVRILSALALDKLHSDKGDKIIYDVARNTANESLKNICSALAIESFKTNQNISSK